MSDKLINNTSKNARQRKHILIISPTLHMGGQERVAINTANIMSRDFDVSFLTFDMSEAFYRPICEILNIDIPASNNLLLKILHVIRRALVIRRIKKKKRIDVTISFGETANLVNVLSRRGKTITSIRGYASTASGYINRYVLSKADIVICCSEKMRCDMIAQYTFYASKFKFMPNVYDAEKILEYGRQTVNDYTWKGHTIVTHGRLVKAKNYTRLMRAFSLVKNEIRDAQLLIIGSGEEKKELLELSCRLGVQDSVHLIGRRKNPFAYLSKSDLYVLPSLTEGFPNALVEGMFFLPVVAADCKTGPREILSKGTLDKVANDVEEVDYGILVMPDSRYRTTADITDSDMVLAKAITVILKDPVKSQNMRELALLRAKEFSIESYRARLTDMLNN